MKICPKCNERPKASYHGWCKPCKAANQKWHSIRYRYGLEREQYEAMQAEKEGECHLCGDIQKKMVVDHCHDTGRVRGWICQSCNVGLAFWERVQAEGLSPDSYLSDVVDWRSWPRSKSPRT